MVDVVVEFDYDAEQPDELTIRVGDVIKHVIMSEGGWWEGELNGKKGMFPDNFVKVIEKREHKEEKKESKVGGNQRASVRELASKLKDGVHVGPAIPGKKKDTSSIKHKKAKVLFDYEPENEDELKIDVGDIVDVFKQEEEGWWEGSLNGKVGVFPSNFVEIIEEPEPEKTDKPPEEDKHTEPQTGIKGKKIIGVGLGNIFQGGPIKLRSTAASETKEKETKPVEEPQPASPVVKREKPELVTRTKLSVEKAVVRYSYSAENDDELTLSENDVVTVLDKDLEDAGWWKGELNGKVGVFPDNFVELLPQEDHNSGKQNRPASTVLSKIPPQPKPKKPPPPTTVPGTKAVNKPPEKPPEPVQKPLSKPAEKVPEPTVPEPAHTDKHGHHDRHKKKDHHAETEKQTPPALPGKKPVLPPPVGKKPTKPDPPRPSSMHETKAEEDHHSDSKLMSHSMIEGLESKSGDKKGTGFDALEPSTEKLRHLTANRAKGPTNKRPPSTVIFNNEEERNGDVKESHWIKEEKERHTTKKLQPPPVTEVKEEPQPPREKPSTAPSRPPEPTIAPAVFQSAIEELRKELRELKANTVSKAAFEELKTENEKLRQEVETLKSSYSKKIRDLTNEVDDEKKIRLNTQVEIERIRKLVNESHV